MKYINSIVYIGKEEVIQVNISSARKHHQTGNTVYIFPCDAPHNRGWVLPEQIPNDKDFDEFVSEYKKNKLNHIVGKRPIFFIHKKSIDKWKIITR